MDEKWMIDMRRKLEGYRVPPPDGLWESICEELGFPPEPVSKPTTLRRWYWAAAAAILALVGFFVVYQFPEQTASPTETTLLGEDQQPRQDVSPYEEPDRTKEGEKEYSRLAKAVTKGSHDDRRRTNADTHDNSTSDTQDCQIVNTTERDTIQTKEESPVVPQTKRNPAVVSQVSDRTEYHSERTGKWSFGLQASGGLLADNTAPQDFINSNAKISEESSTHHSDIQIPNYEWNHDFPVRFGLSLHYQMNQRVALLSGISYTRLSSTATTYLYNKTYKQQLHYIGIPLGLSWQLLSNSRFNLYLAGSAMVEKCVHSSLSMPHENPLEKPWQLSVRAAAGAECCFSRHVGFYFEPSLGYYFDDGTSLKHYYREHSLVPNIEFGLRLHLNK